MKNQNKILITVPASTARGGITNYYQVLKDEFSSDIIYFERGARTWPIRKGFFAELIRAWKDYKAFKKRLKQNDVALVQTTTSLGLSTTIRDGLFLKYANRKDIKTIVFFRGWDEKAVLAVEKKYKKIFKHLFFSCDSIIVLTYHAKDCIKKWGYTGDVIVETTLVDKKLIETVNEKQLVEKNKSIIKEKKLSLLFLSRIEKRKGIYDLLDAFKKLEETKLDISLFLNICGDGFELESIKQIVQKENLNNVTISGFVSGKNKIEAYKNANVFIFPSYGEGMPNAVLEAMGFGLPVITTKVGGIKDFFEDGKNGAFIEIANSNDIAEKIKMLINNIGSLTDISLHNFEMANREFRSDIVAKRMGSIFNKVIKQEK